MSRNMWRLCCVFRSIYFLNVLHRIYGRRKRRRRKANVKEEEKTRVASPVDVQPSVALSSLSVPKVEPLLLTAPFNYAVWKPEICVIYCVIIEYIRHKHSWQSSVLCVCFLGRRNVNQRGWDWNWNNRVIQPKHTSPSWFSKTWEKDSHLVFKICIFTGTGVSVRVVQPGFHRCHTAHKTQTASWRHKPTDLWRRWKDFHRAPARSAAFLSVQHVRPIFHYKSQPQAS